MANEYRITTLAAEVSRLKTGVSFYALSIEAAPAPLADEITTQFHTLAVEATHEVLGSIRLYNLNLEAAYQRTDPEGNRLDYIAVEVERSLVTVSSLAFFDEPVESWEVAFSDIITLGFYNPGVESFQLSLVPVEAYPSTPAEWNPYRPDIPIQLDSDPDVYEYLRHQAETIREQHDLIQAGDTTFPWEMTSDYSDEQHFTLGSLARFFHDSFGMLYARFVKFESDVPQRRYVVGHVKGGTRWHVTAVYDDSGNEEIAGITMPWDTNLEGKWGWVQVYGPNPYLISAEPDTYTIDSQLTWLQSGYPGNGAGASIGRMLVDSGGTIPVGGLLIDVNGFTDEYYKDLANDATASLEARVTALEAAAADDQVDYSTAIATIQEDLATLQARFDLESRQRSQSDASLNDRIYNIETLLQGFDGADNLSAISSQLSLLNTSFNTHLTNYNSFKTAITVQVNEIDSRLMAAEATLLTIPSALAGLAYDISGLTLAMTEVNTRIDDLVIDDLVDVDTTTTPPTAGQALIWDDVNSVWIPGDVASGGGGGGGPVVVYGQLDPHPTSVSSTGQASKGIRFTPQVDIDLYSLLVHLNELNAADYEVNIWTLSGNNLDSLIATSDPWTASATAEAWRFVEIPATLVADTEYAILVSATNRADSYALTMYSTASSSRLENIPIEGVQYTRIALANPATTDTLSSGTGSYAIELFGAYDVVGTSPASGGSGGQAVEATYTEPPLLTNWTQQNFKATTSAADIVAGVNGPVNGVRLRNDPTANIGNTNYGVMLLRAKPASTNWRVTARIRYQGVTTSFNTFGMILRESSTGKSVTYGWISEGTYIGRQYKPSDDGYTSVAGFGTATKNLSTPIDDCWMRVGYDGTNTYFETSLDGYDWVRHYQNAGQTAGNLTTAPTHIGVGLGINDSGAVTGSLAQRSIDVLSWLEETLP